MGILDQLLSGRRKDRQVDELSIQKATQDFIEKERENTPVGDLPGVNLPSISHDDALQRIFTMRKIGMDYGDESANLTKQLFNSARPQRIATEQANAPIVAKTEMEASPRAMFEQKTGLNPSFNMDQNLKAATIGSKFSSEDIARQRLEETRNMNELHKQMMELEKRNKDLSRDERSARREERMDDRTLKFSQTIENDPVIKKMKEQDINISQLNGVVNLARQGNTVASAAMGMKMARTMGEVGVATDSDIVKYVQSGRLDRKSADILSRWTQGIPTKATLNEIEQIVGVLSTNYDQKVQKVYNKYVDRFARNADMTPEKASFVLNVPYTIKVKNRMTQETGSIPIDEFDAELYERVK